jgi:SAM-dependent methyltransferase
MDDRDPAALWASGDAYESYVGRWSRLVAREFLNWLAVPSGGRWLDIGCGTGALTQTILASASPSQVQGIDPSEGFVAHARAHVTDPRARFETGTATHLPFVAGRFDAAVSGLVLNFVPDAPRAVAEMARVVRPGGVVAGYVWDYAGQMQMMRHFWDAAVAVDPAAAALDEGRRSPLCHPERLRTLVEDAGLVAVATRAIDIPTRFLDFDDYWTPFLGGNGPAPAYAMSLSEERRVALRERIRSRLPVGPDGTIVLMARAWAARGSRA